MTKKKETEIVLNSTFIFAFYVYLKCVEYFPRPAVLFGQSVRGITKIILANCESFVCGIGGLRVLHVCL